MVASGFLIAEAGFGIWQSWWLCSLWLAAGLGAEVEMLASLGCTTFQGYYFFRPLPAVAFDTAISDQSWLIRLIGSEKAGHKLSA